MAFYDIHTASDLRNIATQRPSYSVPFCTKFVFISQAVFEPSAKNKLNTQYCLSSGLKSCQNILGTNLSLPCLPQIVAIEFFDKS